MQVKIFSTLGEMKLNEWIRSAREHKQLTQEQLGELLGVTKGNISAWENERHEPSYGNILKIIEVTAFGEPLPGLGSPIVAQAAWPFRKLSMSKVEALEIADLAALEAAVILSADKLGIDVKK